MSRSFNCRVPELGIELKNLSIPSITPGKPWRIASDADIRELAEQQAVVKIQYAVRSAITKHAKAGGDMDEQTLSHIATAVTNGYRYGSRSRATAPTILEVPADTDESLIELLRAQGAIVRIAETA